jgi:hypothetical protein
MREVVFMKTVIEKFFKSLEIGEPASHEGLTAFPVFSSIPCDLPHITLNEAFRNDSIENRELTQGGTVPELLVVNKGDENILILDGEELQGAKQNRVLNITVLIAANAKVVVPVSCTERGRWHYTSSVFADSGTMAARSVRFSKNRSVGENIRSDSSFRSDQMEVWDHIDELTMKSRTRSRTCAMRDVFQEMESKMDSFSSSLPLRDGQRGVIFFWGGDPAGFEYVAKAGSFRELYPRILKSYAVEIAAGKIPARGEAGVEQAREFLGRASMAGVSVKESAGRGEDVRFAGKGLIGSALVHNGEILHAVFFPDEKEVRRGINRRPVR